MEDNLFHTVYLLNHIHEQNQHNSETKSKHVIRAP